MATIDDKIKALETKLKQEKARKLKMEAVKKAAETKKQRAMDTRKKILVGSFLLNNFSEPRELKIGEKLFKDFLVRDDDRELFGWKPLPKAEQAAPAAPVPAPAPVAPQAPQKDRRDKPVFLNVGMIEKDQAKALGAQWNVEQKKWFVPAGVDVSLFQRWLP